jgi:hypothetical protein
MHGSVTERGHEVRQVGGIDDRRVAEPACFEDEDGSAASSGEAAALKRAGWSTGPSPDRACSSGKAIERLMSSSASRPSSAATTIIPNREAEAVEDRTADPRLRDQVLSNVANTHLQETVARRYYTSERSTS